MWRIMVADDEPKIRSGLCRYLERSGLPLTICAQAGDGEEAFYQLQQLRPHIVLLDICMPHMDGLEFLAEAKRSGIRSKCIVLTGFDEFSFAQQSVSLRAFAYLLKPVNEPELTAHLQNAINELEVEHREEQKSKQAMVQLEHNQSLLKSAFEQKWLDGQLDEAAWREGAAFWGIEWPQSAHLILIKPEFKHMDVLYKQEPHLLLFGAANIAQEMFAPLGVCFQGRSPKEYCSLITAMPPSAALLKEVGTAIRQAIKVHCQLATLPLEHPADLSKGIATLKLQLDESERTHPMIDCIQAFVDQHYADPDFVLADLANELNVSQPYLSRLMKTTLSTTFIDYLTAKRINEAICLMKNPENKLSWISTQVGYSNQHYFSAVFKKHTGMSPSVYRETIE